MLGRVPFGSGLVHIITQYDKKAGINVREPEASIVRETASIADIEMSSSLPVAVADHASTHFDVSPTSIIIVGRDML